MEGIIFVTFEMFFMNRTGQKAFNKLILKQKRGKSKKYHQVNWLKNKRKNNNNFKKKIKFISLKSHKIKTYYKTGINSMIVS